MEADLKVFSIFLVSELASPTAAFSFVILLFGKTDSTQYNKQTEKIEAFDFLQLQEVLLREKRQQEKINITQRLITSHTLTLTVKSLLRGAN